jgi:hypothetical protein
MNLRKLHIFFAFFMLLSFGALAQNEDIKIELGKKTLLIDESFVIKVILRNSEKWDISAFPIIQGFTKGSKQVLHTQSMVNGKKIPLHTITQTYNPIREGSFKVPNFTLLINEKEITTEGFTLVVSPPNNDENEAITEEITTEQAKSNAFLAISSDKNSVYVGEGFKVSLIFYLSETSSANIDFTDDKDLNAQIDAIAKKLKPIDCLEERVLITQIKPTPTSFSGKKFSGYKVFEALYFPINAKTILFPSVELKMNFTKTNNQKEILKFTSKNINIQTKDLPPHPLKDKVVVGNFSLSEQIENRKIRTGKTFNYGFKIIGEGNFSTINLGNIANDSHFDFFQPSIKENHQIGEINGEKTFRFRIMPKDSGQHQLGNYFSWIYFNTKKQQYDTLKSHLKIMVSGSTIEDETTDSEDIYAGIEKVDSSIVETNYKELIKNITNIVIILMFIGFVFLFDFKKRKKS